MNNSLSAVSCVLLAGIAVAQAHEEGREHGAHEHGVGRVDIAVDGHSVDIDMDGPAVNLVGFEHEAVDAKEKATLDKAVTDLQRGDGLLVFSPAARCTQQRARVSSDLLEHEHGAENDRDAAEKHPHDEKEEHSSADGHGDADEHDHDHADITVTWQWTCAHPEQLHEVDFSGLFRRFPGTHTLRVQAVLPGGQTATELTPSGAKLKM